MVGGEDALIDGAATAGGVGAAGLAGTAGLPTGPGAAALAGAAFFGASVAISEAGDFLAGAMNQALLPGYFPP